MYHLQSYLITFNLGTPLSATKFEEEVCYTPTEEDIINDITRQNDEGVVEIDDDKDDSHKVPKISTSKVTLLKC